VKDDIKNLYDLFYSSVVTPYNLLENAKLPNYSYVNYYMGDDGLIAEMKCEIEAHQEKVVFYYHFDKEDKLDQVFIEEGVAKKKLIYDRKTEKKYQIKDILKNRMEYGDNIEEVI
jgi:hypothetical protein